MVARSRGPYYELSDPVKCCGTVGMVRARKKAREDARKFGFETETRIIEVMTTGRAGGLINALKGLKY